MSSLSDEKMLERALERARCLTGCVDDGYVRQVGSTVDWLQVAASDPAAAKRAFECYVNAVQRRPERVRPAGDAGSAATRIRLALEGLQEPDRMNALVTACRSVNILGVLETLEGGRWLIGVGKSSDLDRPSDPRPPRRDRGASGILAQVVDLLALCSGDSERTQVINAAGAFFDLAACVSLPRRD